MIRKSKTEMIAEFFRNVAAGFHYTAPFYWAYSGHDLDTLLAMLALGTASLICGIVLERRRK